MFCVRGSQRVVPAMWTLRRASRRHRRETKRCRREDADEKRPPPAVPPKSFQHPHYGTRDKIQAVHDVIPVASEDEIIGALNQFKGDCRSAVEHLLTITASRPAAPRGPKGAPPPPPPPPPPPTATISLDQVMFLKDVMGGVHDADICRAALLQCGGNMEQAMQTLASQPAAEEKRAASREVDIVLDRWLLKKPRYLVRRSGGKEESWDEAILHSTKINEFEARAPWVCALCDTQFASGGRCSECDSAARVVWECKTDLGWAPYPEADSVSIEKQYRLGSSMISEIMLSFVIPRHMYQFNFDDLMQINVSTKVSRKIRRIPAVGRTFFRTIAHDVSSPQTFFGPDIKVLKEFTPPHFLIRVRVLRRIGSTGAEYLIPGKVCDKENDFWVPTARICFVINYIVDISCNPSTSKPEYLVRWTGYEADDDTWEPLNGMDSRKLQVLTSGIPWICSRCHLTLYSNRVQGSCLTPCFSCGGEKPVVWLIELETGLWHPYGAGDSLAIESAFAQISTVSCEITLSSVLPRRPYVFDFRRMIQTNTGTKMQRSIRRELTDPAVRGRIEDVCDRQESKSSEFEYLVKHTNADEWTWRKISRPETQRYEEAAHWICGVCGRENINISKVTCSLCTLSKPAAWRYYGEDGRWIPYSVAAAYKLEIAFRRGSTSSDVILAGGLRFNFRNMTETRNNSTRRMMRCMTFLRRVEFRVLLRAFISEYDARPSSDILHRIAIFSREGTIYFPRETLTKVEMFRRVLSDTHVSSDVRAQALARLATILKDKSLMNEALAINSNVPIVNALAGDMFPDNAPAHYRRAFEFAGGANVHHFCQDGFDTSIESDASNVCEMCYYSMETCGHASAAVCLVQGNFSSLRMNDADDVSVTIRTHYIESLAALGYVARTQKKCVRVHGEMRSHDDIIFLMRRFGDKALSHRVFIVRGVDNDRPAWYHVLVTGPTDVFKRALNDKIIQLENHGKIIYSAYGEECPKSVTDMVKVQFGIDAEADVDYQETFEHLAYFLSSVPIRNLEECLRTLYEAKETYGNKATAAEQAQLIDDSVKKANTIRVVCEKSHKAVIAMYTANLPVPVFRLLNAPFYAVEQSSSLYENHRMFLKLFITALRSLPASCRYMGRAYRGVSTEGKPRLQRLVSCPDVSFTPGAILTFGPMTSVSLLEAKADDFADGGLKFIFLQVEGYDIKDFSFFYENEVLLEGPYQVVVRSWDKDSRGCTVVTVDSIERGGVFKYLE